MKPNERSVTLRQLYDAQKCPATKFHPSPQARLKDDSFLGELVGRPIRISFMNGEETVGILKAFYMYAIKLEDGRIVFKHAVQVIRPADRRKSFPVLLRNSSPKDR